MPITRLINNLQVSFGTISTYPSVGLNVATPSATVHIVAPANNIKTVIVQGASGQVQDPFEVQDNSTNILFGVSPAGNALVRGTITAGSGATVLTDGAGKILAAALNTVGPAQGGLGVTSLTGNGVLVANSGGTSVNSTVGTSTGQVLTWNGTTWAPTAQAGGGNVSTGAGTTTGTITKWQGSTSITDSVITEFTGGLIGINKAVPTAKLHVKSAAVGTSTLILERVGSQTADLLKLVAEDGTTPIMTISASGTVGMGVAANQNNLITVSGTLATAGTDLSGWNGNGVILAPANTFSAYFSRIGGSVTTTGGATNPNAYGQYIDVISKTGGGTVSQAYGIYVSLPTAGNINSAAYFGGRVSIGNGQVTEMLGVRGFVPLNASSDSDAIRVILTLNPADTKTSTVLNITPTINVASGSVTYRGIAINNASLLGSGAVSSAVGLLIANPTIGTVNYAADIRGQVGIGGSGTSVINQNALLALGGTITAATASQAFGLYENVTLTPDSSQNAVFNYFGGVVATGASTTTATTFGIYLAPMTKTGGGSVPTSYGIYISPSTLATANYSAYFGDRVGINQNAPAAMVHIVNNNNTVPVTITQAAAGQTGNIHEWWSSSALQVNLTASGTLLVAPTAPAFPNIATRAASGAVFSSPAIFSAQDNSGNPYFTVGAIGNVGIGSTSFANQSLHITIPNAGTAGLVIQQPASPTNDIIQWTTSSPTILGSISQYGTLGLGASGLLNIAVNITNTISPLTTTDAYGINVNPGSVVAPTSGNIPNLYGIRVNPITRTGTGTITNTFGLHVTASAGGTNNYSAVFMGGNVGIGKANPGTPLDVVGNIASTGTISATSVSATSVIGTNITSFNSIGGVTLGVTTYSGFGGITPDATKSVRIGGNYQMGISLEMVASLGVGTSGFGINSAPTFTAIANTGTESYGQYIKITKSGGFSIPTIYGIYVDTLNFTGPAPTYYPAILMGGNVGIGIASPVYVLHVNGTLGIAGAATFASTITAVGTISCSGSVTAVQGLAAGTTANSNVGVDIAGSFTSPFIIQTGIVPVINSSYVAASITPSFSIGAGVTGVSTYSLYVVPSNTGAGMAATAYGAVIQSQTATTSIGLHVNGNTEILGALSKTSGTFAIDHPLFPREKILYHGFVEGPRYYTIYTEKITLHNGQAEVDIDEASTMSPGTFMALTQHREVTSLYNKSGFARVRASEIEDGKFTIFCEDETSNDTIVWTVIAERNDAFIHTINNVDSNGRLMPEFEKEEIDHVFTASLKSHEEMLGIEKADYSTVPHLYYYKKGYLLHPELEYK